MRQYKAVLYRFQLHLDKWFLLLLVMGGLGLRLYRLEQESLWLDEILQTLIAKNPTWWLTILHSVKHQGNTPLDYLITHLTLRIGQSEGILRLPAAIWGTCSIIVIFRLGQDMFNRATGYLAAFLLAIIPLHVDYSREVRFYSLATFLYLLTLYAFVRAVGKNTGWSWVLYGVANLLALYAHYYVLILIAMQGVWLLWAVYAGRYSRSVLIAFSLMAGLVFLLFLPWLYYDIRFEQVYGQGFLNQYAYQFRFPHWVRFLGGFFLTYRSQIPALRPEALTGPSLGWIGFAWGTMLVGGFLVPLRRRSDLDFTTHMTLLMFLLLGGVSSVLVMAYLESYSLYYNRQFLIFTPLMVLTVSATCLQVLRIARSRLVRNLTQEMADKAAIIPIALFSLWALWQPLTDIYSIRKEDWRGTARYLMRHLRSGDVLVTPHGPHIKLYAPELSWQIEELDDVPSLLETARSYRRVWIFGLNHVLEGSYPDVYQWIKQERPIEVSVDPRLWLYVYSTSIPESQLLEELLYTRAYPPGTLLFSDFLERIIREGHFAESVDIVAQVFDDSALRVSEKVEIAMRAGRALSDYGAQDRAKDILVRATSLAPANVTAWTHLGLVYTRQGRWEDATRAYQKALESDPKAYWANHLLAGILYRQEQWQDVIRMEETAVQSAANADLRVASLIQIARAHSKMGNTVEACDVLRQAYTTQKSRDIGDEMTKLGCKE